jgi:flavin-dependent dehydrogenase
MPTWWLMPPDISLCCAPHCTGAPALNRKFSGGDLAYACRTIRRLDTIRAASDDLVDHYRYGAFKGYFWTHLHHDDSVDVGGGVKEAPGRVDPMAIIKEMIAERPSITDEELGGGGGIVLVGKSPWTLAATGFVVVGDAAGQVIPTTGCGVGGAMTGALLAADAINAALKKGGCTLKISGRTIATGLPDAAAIWQRFRPCGNPPGSLP